MEYLLHLLIIIEIYIILAISLNLIAGYTGLVSVAHAAFYGIGAYVVALMGLHFSSPFFLNLLLSMVISGALGALVAIPSLRIHDDYFIIATFAFQILILSAMNNWVALTRGPLGLPGIPAPTLFGLTIASRAWFLAMISGFTLLTFLFSTRLVGSPIGRILKAIREDEIFAQSLGKNVTYYKIVIFVIGTSMAGMAGGLYASYITFIDPTSFTVMESVLMLTMVIIGGAGNIWGSLLGASVLVLIPEALRFLGLPNYIAGNLRQIIYGGLLIAFMLLRPQGIIGKYAFTKK